MNVNHIDGFKSNNKVDNLEWVTDKENMEHASAIGLLKLSTDHLKKLKSAGVKALSKPVINIETNIIYDSLLSASVSVGLHRKTFQKHMRKGVEKRFRFLNPQEAIEKGYSISKHIKNTQQ